jgi:hypothetical protein
MLYETQPLEAAVFFSVAAILGLVTGFACLAPAWRASRLDPMQASRTEQFPRLSARSSAQ